MRYALRRTLSRSLVSLCIILPSAARAAAPPTDAARRDEPPANAPPADAVPANPPLGDASVVQRAPRHELGGAGFVAELGPAITMFHSIPGAWSVDGAGNFTDQGGQAGAFGGSLRLGWGIPAGPFLVTPLVHGSFAVSSGRAVLPLPGTSLDGSVTAGARLALPLPPVPRIVPFVAAGGGVWLRGAPPVPPTAPQWSGGRFGAMVGGGLSLRILPFLGLTAAAELHTAGEASTFSLALTN